MAEDTPAGTEAPKPSGLRDRAWWDAHPEEKEKQRQRAQELVAQGKFGGANNGRRRKRPAYEQAAIKAAAKAEELANELVAQALEAPNRRDRQSAIKLLFDMEQRVRQERRDEEDHFAKMTGDELTAELFTVLRELTGMSEFDIELDPDQVEEISDGNEATEVGATQQSWPT